MYQLYSLYTESPPGAHLYSTPKYAGSMYDNLNVHSFSANIFFLVCILIVEAYCPNLMNLLLSVQQISLMLSVLLKHGSAQTLLISDQDFVLNTSLLWSLHNQIN